MFVVGFCLIFFGLSFLNEDDSATASVNSDSDTSVKNIEQDNNQKVEIDQDTNVATVVNPDVEKIIKEHTAAVVQESLGGVSTSTKTEKILVASSTKPNNAAALAGSTSTKATSTTSVTIATKATTTLFVKKETTPTVQKETEFKLKVPFFSQQYVNSCEAAALRMALTYFGIKTDDRELVNLFGYDPKPKDIERNIWDDPQKMFVGSIDVSGPAGGYGVYGLPVTQAAKTLGRNAEYRTTLTPKQLATEIKAGHPVIIWGYTSFKQPPYTWNTVNSSGMIDGTVKAFQGEHARLVVGFVGQVSSPKGFYVHDPQSSEGFTYMSTENIMQQFSAVPGVTNQLVVVK